MLNTNDDSCLRNGLLHGSINRGELKKDCFYVYILLYGIYNKYRPKYLHLENYNGK